MMREISTIRDALSEIEGARFPISSKKPRIRVSGTVTCGECSLSDIEVSQEQGDLTQSVPNEQEIEQHFQRLDRTVGIDGLDALSWYVSFHNSSDEWGIYIPTTSIHYLSRKLMSLHTIENLHSFDQIAVKILLLHEIFHFYADYAQTQFELIIREPCRNILRAQLGVGKYLEIEEAAANAFMLRHLEQECDDDQIEAVRRFTLIQPAGYRDGAALAQDDQMFQQALCEVVKSYVGLPMHSKSIFLDPTVIHWDAFYPSAVDDFLYDCPIYFLQDSDRFGLPELEPKFFTSVNEIRETSYFEKRLARLPSRYQDAWREKKAQLSQPPLNRKQFERLKGERRGIYSVRVGKGHRAHLKPVDGYSHWDALDIGTHTEMGHD